MHYILVILKSMMMEYRNFSEMSEFFSTFKIIYAYIMTYVIRPISPLLTVGIMVVQHIKQKLYLSYINAEVTGS